VSCDGSDEYTQSLIDAIQQSGQCWVGGSVWQGKKVIRISVCSWVTTQEDVSISVEAFITARAAISGK
jgi:hypothetical protein